MLTHFQKYCLVLLSIIDHIIFHLHGNLIGLYFLFIFLIFSFASRSFLRYKIKNNSPKPLLMGIFIQTQIYGLIQNTKYRTGHHIYIVWKFSLKIQKEDYAICKHRSRPEEEGRPFLSSYILSQKKCLRTGIIYLTGRMNDRSIFSIISIENRDRTWGKVVTTVFLFLFN